MIARAESGFALDRANTDNAIVGSTAESAKLSARDCASVFVRDALVMISDGLPELRNERGEELGYGAVRRCVEDNADRPAADLVQALVDLGEEWREEELYDDDVTVMVIRRV